MRLRDTPGGDDMRRAIMYAALLAAALLCSSTNAVAQQSPVMVAAVTRAPNTEVWTHAGRHFPQTPIRRGMNVPKNEVPARAPSTLGVEMPEGAEMGKDDDGKLQTVIDEETFLLPVRHHSLWAMPPGGLTRWLIQPPVPIDPHSTVAAPGPVTRDDGVSARLTRR